MRKAIIFIGLILFISGLFSLKVFGSDSVIDVYCDGSYNEGYLYAVEDKTEEWAEYQTFRYYLTESGKVSIHFISHTPTIKVEVKDTDENLLIDEYVGNNDSPKDFELYQNEGEYYIHVLTFYGDDVGDYKFKMDFTPSTISSNSISVGETYKGLFTSLEDVDNRSQQVELLIPKEAEYNVSLKCDTSIECIFRTEDEDKIERIVAFNTYPYKDTIVLPEGKLIVEFNSGDSSGFYELLVSPVNEVKVETEQAESTSLDNMENQLEDIEKQPEDTEKESKDTKIQSQDKSSILDDLLSPSTFIGALVVAVVGGVLVGLILRAI